MNRIGFFGMLMAFSLCVVGCGPLRSPMAPRPTEEGQKKLAESWEKAFAELDKIDHQQLLDIYVGTNAFQLGVDKLYFRSEKRSSRGLVVMEIHYDFAKPSDDRFEVIVFDSDNKVLRKERYGREEVETTRSELFDGKREFYGDEKKDSPELAERRAKHKARWERITSYFPKDEEKQAEAKKEK